MSFLFLFLFFNFNFFSPKSGGGYSQNALRSNASNEFMESSKKLVKGEDDLLFSSSPEIWERASTSLFLYSSLEMATTKPDCCYISFMSKKQGKVFRVLLLGLVQNVLNNHYHGETIPLLKENCQAKNLKMSCCWNLYFDWLTKELLPLVRVIKL